nr:sterol carrier protein domain-containing protein [Mastigocladopsis repens]
MSKNTLLKLLTVQKAVKFEYFLDKVKILSKTHQLSVANGCAEVTSGGKGEMKLDIRGLAPLYTGLFTPQQLQFAGQLDATQTAMSAATQIFAGASPWMADFF